MRNKQCWLENKNYKRWPNKSKKPMIYPKPLKTKQLKKKDKSMQIFMLTIYKSNKENMKLKKSKEFLEKKKKRKSKN